MKWFFLILLLTQDNQSYIQFHGPFDTGYECAEESVPKKTKEGLKGATILFQSPCFSVPETAIK